MLKRLLSLGAAAVTALTAACEEGPSTVRGTWRSPAATSTMVWANARGPILVEVHGNPFTLADHEFRALIADGLSNKVVGRVVRFTAQRDQAPHPDARVVVAFDAPENFDAQDLCAGGPVPVAAQSGERIAIIASFCHDAKILSSVRGWVVRGDGPDDKRFRRLLGQVARELFPEST